jgi:hypothetical protein
MNKSKSKSLLIFTAVGILFLVVFTYLFINESDFSTKALVTATIPFLTAFITSFIVAKRARELRRGEVMADERTHLIALKTGNTTLFATLYLLTFLGIFIKDNQFFGLDLKCSDVVGILILSMGIIYFISFLIHKSKHE